MLTTSERPALNIMPASCRSPPPPRAARPQACAVPCPYVVVKPVFRGPLQKVHERSQPFVRRAQARRFEGAPEVPNGYVTALASIQLLILLPPFLARHRHWERTPLLHLQRHANSVGRERSCLGRGPAARAESVREHRARHNMHEKHKTQNNTRPYHVEGLPHGLQGALGHVHPHSTLNHRRPVPLRRECALEAPPRNPDVHRSP